MSGLEAMLEKIASVTGTLPTWLTVACACEGPGGGCGRAAVASEELSMKAPLEETGPASWCWTRLAAGHEELELCDCTANGLLVSDAIENTGRAASELRLSGGGVKEPVACLGGWQRTVEVGVVEASAAMGVEESDESVAVLVAQLVTTMTFSEGKLRVDGRESSKVSAPKASALFSNTHVCSASPLARTTEGMGRALESPPTALLAVTSFTLALAVALSVTAGHVLVARTEAEQAGAVVGSCCVSAARVS